MGEQVLSSPGNFIEELTDKVIVQIDRLATTGFNAALDELVRYHNFLLAVYASRSGDGQPLSLAQFGAWEQPHQGWTREYRRVFERAVERLIEDPVFFETMAHVPARLLPENAAEHPAAVLEAILDMGLLQVIFLEAWVTRRTTVAVAERGPAQPRLALAGSDQRAYEEVVLRVIGAWERLTRVVDQLYRWREAQNDPTPLWKAYRSSWPYLERHLRNTAYFLVSAVWNEDAFGAERYRDMLLRWLGTFRLQPTLDYTLRHHRLLTPDLLELDWTAAVDRLVPYRRGPVGPGPAPQPLFETIVQWAFDDIVILTAAITLTWYLGEQQASDIGGQTAARLLRGQVIEEEGTRVPRPGGARPGDTFERIFAIIIREDLVTRLAPGRYGTRLDDLVRYLSQMSERRVVPGRVYTSWGLHGVETVSQEILVMLLANLPEDGDNRLVEGIGGIAANEDLFVDRDEALRRIWFDIDKLGNKLADQVNQPVLERGFDLLAPNGDFAGAVVRLQAIITAAKDVISLRRQERLKARPPDPEKIGKLRSNLEHAIGWVEGQLPVFRGFLVGHAATPTQRTDQWRIRGIDKGELVTPPLSPERTGMFELIVDEFTAWRGLLAWNSFCRRKRQRVQIAASRYPVGFWNKVIELAADFGTEAVLVVPYDPIGGDISTWTIQQPDDLPGLHIEYRQDQPTGGGFGYTATIEGINVYTAHFPPDRAWLFSARSLRSVRYARLPTGDLVDLAFDEADDPRASSFVASFAQEVEWNDLPIIELVLRSRKATQAAGVAA
jgi:hypothetical protein